MTTVAYYRRSTEIQENSIEMQRQLARALSYKKALVIDEEFVDDAVSGRKTDIKGHKALSAMLSKIESGEVTNILVYKRDRLARKAVEYLEIFQLLKTKKVNVYFTAENEIPILYTPTGELIELLMAGIIQREGEQIVERITETIKANFQRGKIAGNLPFGYTFDKDTKTIYRDEENLEIVKQIYQILLDNEFQSMKQVTDYLKDQNIKINGKLWTSQMVKSIITNPTYMGVRLLNLSGEVIKSNYDELAILSENEWVAAQTALDSLITRKKSIKKEVVYYHLENLVICKECNQPLKPKQGTRNKNTINYYSCFEHKIKVEKQELEKRVLEASKEFFKELMKSNLPDLYKRYGLETIKNLQANIKELEQVVQKLYKKLENQTEKWINETQHYEKQSLEDSLVSLYKEIEDYERQIQEIQKEILELQSNSKNENGNFISLELKDIKNHNLSILFDDIISEVKVDSNAIQIKFKHPFLTVKEALHTHVG